MSEQPRMRRTPPPEVGVTINRARLRAGLRVREAARVVGLAPSYLLRLETGQRCPSRTTVMRLHAVLDFEPVELVALLAAAVTDAGLDYPGRGTAA